MSNEKKLYFSQTTRTLLVKNKLEKDVLALVETQLNRVLLPGNEIQPLVKDFQKNLKALHEKHPRCKEVKVIFDSNRDEEYMQLTRCDFAVYNDDLFQLNFYQVVHNKS